MANSIYESTTKDLKDNEFKIKKFFGQNFIVDENILINIVKEAGITKDYDVIEIGPGLGALTKHLIEKANKVLAFEIDKDLIPILTNKFGDKLDLVNQDILKVNIEEEIKKHFDLKRKIVLVANLPYYITTPILIKLLEETNLIKSYTVMMQDEVANRICSKPNVKDYNSLSILIQYKASAKKVLKISRNIFIPKPEVDSAVIKLDLYDKPIYDLNDENHFYQLIRDAFSQRRKTLMNNLKKSYDKEKLLEYIKLNNLKEMVRPEELSVSDFINLSNFLKGAN